MKKILIVDDEPIMLKVMERILSDHYEIICCSSGKEAIELFDSEKPDMVLSDLRMPEMDGYELRCHLREKSDVPFIFMTADESDESERRGFDIGAADYIRKPANASVLLRRIGNVLNSIEQIQDLKEAASLDALTQLFNRGASQQAITELCQKGPGVLLLLDLDSFKLINDIHGHAIGDRVLVRFAQLLKEAVGSSGLAGRLGGDEFIAYLKDDEDEMSLRDKTKFLNEQLYASAVEYMGEDMGIPLGVSVGAVFVHESGGNFSELCKKADEALYTVKNNGKHGIAFYGKAKASDRADKNGLSKMRQILEERNPEAGAMLLDFDRFQCVYRFLLRLGQKHKSRTQFLCFTLPTDLSREIVEQFRNILQTMLKRSDCILQNGQFQFFVLLTDAGEDEGRWIQERLHEKWAELSPACPDFSCDMEYAVDRF